VKQRLDALLVARGLVESREKARALILAGQVTLDGRPAAKAGTPVDTAADVQVIGPEHPWVSRGGVKLAHALDAFAITVADRLAIDIGASTGGFTDVLLQRGARRVIAIDVGRGQLHWRLRRDARVTAIERLNARSLTRADLPDLGPGADIVTIDVSFISLRHIFPVLPPLVVPGADIVALVKPQFEAGRAEVGKGGIVRNDAVRARVVAEVAAAADALGLKRAGGTESPIEGMEGNKEYLLHLKSDACPPSRR
jgi:23S rRNA (cytidine1920-2'-O)/16S rRNA (cytidine1409-2'-O)-methyltransferase